MKQLIKISLLIVLTGILIGLSDCKKKEERIPNSVYILALDPNSPASMNFGEFVLIWTDYNITNKAGARIWVQPYTNGKKSPGYLYSSSNIYTGLGKKEVGISVEEGDEAEVVVDQLRIVCTTPDQSETLFEEFRDVNYVFNNN